MFSVSLGCNCKVCRQLWFLVSVCRHQHWLDIQSKIPFNICHCHRLHCQVKSDNRDKEKQEKEQGCVWRTQVRKNGQFLLVGRGKKVFLWLSDQLQLSTLFMQKSKSHIQMNWNIPTDAGKFVHTDPTRGLSTLLTLFIIRPWNIHVFYGGFLHLESHQCISKVKQGEE